MFRALAFGKGFGGTSVVLGALGAGGASLMIVDPASVLGPMAGMFTLIIFHFVVGWKVYRLSRDSADSPETSRITLLAEWLHSWQRYPTACSLSSLLCCQCGVCRYSP
jgi:hypothetical protein